MAEKNQEKQENLSQLLQIRAGAGRALEQAGERQGAAMGEGEEHARQRERTGRNAG